ncbi:trimeric LpxA-like protein [Aspergillus sclerotioniger CBS 115572]|uniref:Dynactin subunit 6 n=1 Tax=Aspergillus sclerotioniger CBS 115572 TaxID=1450535 RepID=A0A317X8F1_9EURO|nr:trimeric LpxA-like protein [Aspergillus sclerotioniger CBS 115572]PWY94471.1 trimeric LpxA-like protein [Aspergillus sclerotioniger CBS 115572]
MDPRHSQTSPIPPPPPPKEPSLTPTTHLKPPHTQPHSHHHHHQQPHPHPHPRPSQSHPPVRAPITAHPSATISETTLIQGSHPISIGSGTIIHPRARIYSHEGPIIIGNGCIISEKSVIGAPLPPPPPAPASSSSSQGDEKPILPTRISSNVTISPCAQVLPGAHIHSCCGIEAHAVVGRRAVIGSHSRVCAGCEVAPGDVVKEWMVVWGGAGGSEGQRRRVRVTGKVESSLNVGANANTGNGGLEGRVIEDARLMVLQKEREALVRLIGGRRR